MCLVACDGGFSFSVCSWDFYLNLNVFGSRVLVNFCFHVCLYVCTFYVYIFGCLEVRFVCVFTRFGFLCLNVSAVVFVCVCFFKCANLCLALCSCVLKYLAILNFRVSMFVFVCTSVYACLDMHVCTCGCFECMSVLRFRFPLFRCFRVFIKLGSVCDCLDACL